MSWAICVRVEVVGRRRRRSVQWLIRRLSEVREWGSAVAGDEEEEEDVGGGAVYGFLLTFRRDIIAVGGGGGEASLIPIEESASRLGMVAGTKEFVLRNA